MEWLWKLWINKIAHIPKVDGSHIVVIDEPISNKTLRTTLIKYSKTSYCNHTKNNFISIYSLSVIQFTEKQNYSFIYNVLSKHLTE